jgi:hypothetical protein
VSRSGTREERENATSDHHDFFISHGADHNVECQEVLGTGNVSWLSELYRRKNAEADDAASSPQMWLGRMKLPKAISGRTMWCL